MAISNIRVYNRALYDYEVQALFINSAKINEISLTLPCGQRNDVEEVSKLFKLSVPPSKSSDVVISIKNSKLTTPELQQQFIQEAAPVVFKSLPADTRIRAINFVDYDTNITAVDDSVNSNAEDVAFISEMGMLNVITNQGNAIVLD